MYQIIFHVQCDACGQTLTSKPSGENNVIYAHDNATDCPELDVALPRVTPDQICGLFPPPKKAAPKKKAK